MSQSWRRLSDHKPFGLELLHCGSKQPLAQLSLWGLSCWFSSLAKGHYSTFTPPEQTLTFTVLPPNNTMQNTPVPFGKQTGINKLVSEFLSGSVPRTPHTGEHLGAAGGRGTPAPSLKNGNEE